MFSTLPYKMIGNWDTQATECWIFNCFETRGNKLYFLRNLVLKQCYALKEVKDHFKINGNQGILIMSVDSWNLKDFDNP